MNETQAERLLRAYYAARLAKKGGVPGAMPADREAVATPEFKSAQRAGDERSRRDDRWSIAVAAASIAALAAFGVFGRGLLPPNRYEAGLAAAITIETGPTAFSDAIGAISASWPGKN